MMDHKSLSKRIEQYFENSMTLVYMKHSASEVDFYKWLPTNKFVYKQYRYMDTDDYYATFRLWQSAGDILIEELMNSVNEEIDKTILDTLINERNALPKIK